MLSFIRHARYILCSQCYFCKEKASFGKWNLEECGYVAARLKWIEGLRTVRRVSVIISAHAQMFAVLFISSDLFMRTYFVTAFFLLTDQRRVLLSIC